MSADEGGSGSGRSLVKSLLHRFRDSMQIDSLQNFNQKYDRQRCPRRSFGDDRADLARAGMAIARAESVSVLPPVGRLVQSGNPASGLRPLEKVS